MTHKPSDDTLSQERWAFCPDDDYSDDGHIIRNDSGAMIAEVCMWEDDPDTAEAALANARLIATAPELLAALQWLVDDLTDAEEDRNPETGDEYDSVANARAVLAKARG
jgi:hypothetical protein